LKGFDPHKIQWIDYEINSTMGLNKLEYANQYRSWGVGNKGCLITQISSQKKWIVQTTRTHNCLHDVSFTDSFMGVAVGDGETILFSKSGDNWLCVRNFMYYIDPNGQLLQIPRFKVRIIE